MGRTSPIVRYKKKLITAIATSPELVALINDDYIDENGECVDSDELIYKQIFPYYYIPETQNEQKSYVIMKVNGLGIKNKIYNKAEVFICVISHQGIMKVKGGTRIDKMGEIVEELFNGRDDFGFGEMELVSNIESEINTTHRCRILRFMVEDFNADACKDERQKRLNSKKFSAKRKQSTNYHFNQFQTPNNPRYYRHR